MGNCCAESEMLERRQNLQSSNKNVNIEQTNNLRMTTANPERINTLKVEY